MSADERGRHDHAPAAVKTQDLYGGATCINGERATPRYCDGATSDGRNGNEIFSDHPAGQRQAGRLGQARHAAAGVLQERRATRSTPYIYNNHKRSTWWMQINYSGQNYIPWAWLNLDNGDDINDLPTC